MDYYRYKIVLIGDADSGKIELRENFTEDLFDDANKMTLGVEFAIKTIELDDAKVKFEIWDLTGEERFKKFIPSFVLSARGAIIIIKLENDNSFPNLRGKVLTIKDMLSHAKSGSINIVVLGIQDDSNVNQSKNWSENDGIAKDIGVDIFQVCSITDREVIESIFQQLGRLLVNQSLEELAISNGESYTIVPEDRSILLFRLLGFGLALMVVILAIVSIYLGYLRSL